MILTRIRFSNLRNHRKSELDCSQGIVLLWGENGAGKTSVLEAASMLCTTRSFVSAADRNIVRNGEADLRIEGKFQADTGVCHTVSLDYSCGTARKRVELDNAPLNAASELLGRFPIVTLAPQHRAITSGAPSERRAFLDFVVSQVSHSYLMDLMEYRRILKHRNALLAAHDTLNSRLRAEMEPWDCRMAETAVRIIRRRRAFIGEYQPYFVSAMRGMVGGREIPEFRYQQSIETDAAAGSAAGDLAEELAARLPHDHRRKTTTAGPHRDDLEMLLNGLDVRTHASQGQHKTLLISLKTGEWFYMADHLDERPVILLDDVFSELDDERLSRVLEIIPSLGQTFITTANQSILDRFAGDCALFRVEAGEVRLYAEAA